MAEQQFASPVVLEQTTGSRRVLLFKGRALPFRPLQLSRILQVNTTWLPGNPVANQQVIGNRLEPTTLRGAWHDKFLLSADEDNGVELVNYPQVSPGAQSQNSIASGAVFQSSNVFPGTQPARLARTVDAAVELMMVEGQQLRFSWDQYVRYGRITRYSADFDRINDIAWEMEFTWTGLTQFSPVKRATKYNALTTANGLADILASINENLLELAALKQPNAFTTKVIGPILQLGSTVESLVDALQQIVSIATAPFDLINTITGALEQVRSQVLDLLSLFDTNRSAAGERALVGDADSVQIANLVQQQLRDRLIELSSFARDQQRLAALFQTEDILATIFADSFTSLRDIAREKYGDPSQWTEISEYNGFFSPTVPRGTVIRVPALS